MDVLKKVALGLGILILSGECYSQSGDSIPKKVMKYVADKFPTARTFSMEYTQLVPYKYSSSLMNAGLPESKVTNLYQAKLSANVNLIRKKNWMLGATVQYRYLSATNETADLASGTKNRLKEDYHYHSSSLNFTYISKLFNKMTIYSGSFIVDGSEKHFERLKGLATGTMILKANARTRMTAGLAVIVDPSSQLPVIPTFSYEHKFTNGWVVDIILPKSVLLKRDVFTNGRVSLGTELDRTSFYLYNQGNLGNASRKYEFRQTELNSGVTYEHLLGNNFIATLKTGVRSITSARIFEKSKSFNSYVFEAKPDAAFYLSMGVSFNPFAKAKKK